MKRSKNNPKHFLSVTASAAGMFRLVNKPKAMAWLVEDMARDLFAVHGALLISVCRRLAGILPLRRSYLKLLMLQHRLSMDESTTELVCTALPKILSQIEWLIGPSERKAIAPGEGFRAIVLKQPEYVAGGIHRGVLLIKFTETFRFFFHHIDVPRLQNFFCIVLEPSWSGYCLPEILFWARYKEPIIVQASEALDRSFLSRLKTNLIPISVGASDWVDHRIFRPLNREKTFDVIYVANLNPIKRVHLYLKAVRDLSRRRRDTAAAIVLSSWGGNKGAFDQLLDYYDVRENVRVFMDLQQAELNELLNQSRVSVLLSRKEGSNKTLFESLFADTPIILLTNNVGVNKDYVNPNTGLIVEEHELVDAIERFADGGDSSFTPRTWALSNITPELSIQKIAALIGTLPYGQSVANGRWFVKVNAPEAVYMDSEVARHMCPVGDVLSWFQTHSPQDVEAGASLPKWINSPASEVPGRP